VSINYKTVTKHKKRFIRTQCVGSFETRFNTFRAANERFNFYSNKSRAKKLGYASFLKKVDGAHRLTG
jgi:hypothetical protein